MRLMLGIAVLACAVLAGTDEGKAALANKEFEKALAEFKAAAEAGDAEAQYQLGEMYRRGLGMKKPNPRIAAKWYELARAQDHAEAAGEVGIAMWDAKKKRKHAVELIAKGAAAGHTRSMYYRAKLQYIGAKVPKLAKAEMYALFKRAAEQGHLDAQAIYGSALRKGAPGVEKNPEEAEEWLREAAEKGHPWACMRLGSCLLDRARIPGGGVNVTAQREGFEWKTKAAMHGLHLAQHFLALAHLAGQYYKESYVWAKIGASKKNSRPSDNIAGKILRDGYSQSLKEHMKKVKQYTKPEEVREGDKLVKQYVKEIRANMAKPLPWQEPKR